MIKMANKFPKLRFEHSADCERQGFPKNAGSYFATSTRRKYISASSRATSSMTAARLRAAKADPPVLRNINAFTLGAKLAIRKPRRR